MYSKEEHGSIIGQIMDCTDEVQKRTLLNQLVTDYADVIAKHEETTTKIETLEKENMEYAKLNNQLFLQVGVVNQSNQNNQVSQNTFNNVETAPQKRTFTDLLKEMK